MTDLQFGLLLVGAIAVVAVLVYNRLQERASRRQAERSFGSRHADVLMTPTDPRREPTLEAPAAPPAPREEPPRPMQRPGEQPDPAFDYVIEVSGDGGAAALADEWPSLARRFGPRALLCEAAPGKLYAGLQLVSRNGAVGEAELLEFRSRVEAVASAHGAAVSAPETRKALEAAQSLDRACSEVDVQIALHVVDIPEVPLEEAPFQYARRADGVTLLLDLPRTPEPGACYELMVRCARQLAARHSGRVVDDKGQALDERALGAIEAEVEVLRARLVHMGIEPGSSLALRLFA